MKPSDYKPRDFLWSQLDKRWKNMRLGQSMLTMGGFGCVTMDACYIINRYNKDHGLPRIMPDEVCRRSVYTKTGNFYWNSVTKITKGKLVQTYNPKEADYTLVMTWLGHQTHWITLLNGDLCYNSLANGSACIQKRIQPNYWKYGAGFVYFKIVK